MAINIPDLVKVVKDEIGGTTEQITRGVTKLFEAMADGLAKGEEVKIYGFGIFKSKEMPARKGRNPMNGEEVDVPAKTVARFSPSTILKKFLNK